MHMQDPEKFELASVVSKNSRTGITSNQRLLVIRKGHLYYYSSVPKSFRGDPKILDSVHQLPKCSIQIVNIKNIKGHQSTSSFFSIEFESKYMMQREDIRKTLTLEQYNFAPKGTKEIVTWQFTCENQQTKQQWVTALETLHAFYTKEKVNIQKYFDNINKKQDQISSPSQRSSFIPWRDQSPKKIDSDNAFKKKNQELALQFLNVSSGTPTPDNSLNSPKLYHSTSPPQLTSFSNSPTKKHQSLSPTKKDQSLSPTKKDQPLSPQKLVRDPSIYKVQPRKSQTIIEEEQSEAVQTPIHSPSQQLKKQFSGENLMLRPTQSKQYEYQEYQEEKVLNLDKDVYTIQEYLFPKEFKQKMKMQSGFMQLYSSFKVHAINNFVGLVKSKQIEPKKSVYRKSDVLFKIGFVHTQNIEISGRQRIFYNQEHVKKLKQEFKTYIKIFTAVLQSLRNPQNRCNLRVPLVLFIEYKGICALAIDQKEQYSQQVDQQMKAQRTFIEKIGLDSSNFYFRRAKSSPLIMATIRKSFKLYTHKHHNVAFEPPIDHNFLVQANKQNASTSEQSLQNYIIGLTGVSQFNGVCPKQQLIESLEHCLFSKRLRKIYRSTHGQIQERYFFNLIFNKDPNIISLLNKSGIEAVPSTLKGQLVDFLEYYFGITFEIDTNRLQSGKKDAILATHLFPLVRQCDLDLLEINESFKKFGKYLQTNQIALASQTLQIREQLCDSIQSTKRQSSLNFLQILYKKAELAFAENDYLDSIIICKAYLEQCENREHYSVNSLRKLPIYLFMLKTYSQFSQAEMSRIINQTQTLINYNYGSSNSTLINLWSLASHYYTQSFQKQQIALKLSECSLELTGKIYGARSKQRGEILLDLSRMYKYTELGRAKGYFEEAKQLIKLYGSDEDLILLQTYECSLVLYQGDLKNCESVLKTSGELVEFLRNKYVSKRNMRQLLKSYYELAEYLKETQHSNKAVQEMWELDSFSREVALEMAYKLALRAIEEQSGAHSTHLYCQNFRKRLQSFELELQPKMEQSSEFTGSKIKALLTREEALIKIQQRKKVCGNMKLIELITEGVESNDQQIMRLATLSLGKQKLIRFHEKYLN